jgi:hypothetical protein
MTQELSKQALRLSLPVFLIDPKHPKPSTSAVGNNQGEPRIENCRAIVLPTSDRWARWTFMLPARNTPTQSVMSVGAVICQLTERLLPCRRTRRHAST